MLTKSAFKKNKMIKKISTPILITGAKGFIGSNLLRKLVYEGYETNVILK